MGYEIPGVGKSSDGICTFTNAKYNGIVIPVSGDMTFDLPKASLSTGRFYTFKKTDSNATTVTIDGYGSETIDGQTSIALTELYEVARIFCDGASWHII